MSTNVGTIDRILRIVLGIALIAFALGFIAPGAHLRLARLDRGHPACDGARRLLPALQHRRAVDLPGQARLKANARLGANGSDDDRAVRLLAQAVKRESFADRRENEDRDRDPCPPARAGYPCPHIGRSRHS